MDRFNKPGSRQFEILGQLGPGMPSEVVATVTADSIRFEPGFITFWTGHDNEVKTLTATARHDSSITGVKEVPLSDENQLKLREYYSEMTSQTHRDRFDNFVNLLTGETYREYLDRRDAAEKDDPFIWDGLGSYDIVAQHRHVHLETGRCVKNSFGLICQLDVTE